MENNVSAPPSWAAFIPLFIMLVPFLVMMCFIVRRKGINIFPVILLGFIPLVNILTLIWLASQTDASVKAEIADLKRRLDAKS